MGGTGWLFSICIVNKECYDSGEFEVAGDGSGVFGRIKIDNKDYYLFDLGPSGVEYGIDTEELYMKMYNSRYEIMKSIKSCIGCTNNSMIN